MKILVVSQYYYPEPFKVNEICEGLIKKGHEVTVLTGLPNYPTGLYYEGYEAVEGTLRENINGVDLIRVNLRNRKSGAFNLLLNYISFVWQARKESRNLDKTFDKIFVYQLSPVFMINPALSISKKIKSKVYIYCLDLWPESLKTMGISERNLAFEVIKKISKRLYKRAYMISVSSPSFKEYFENNFDIKKEQITWIPQHGEDLFLNVNMKTELDEKIIITYAGNVGTAQDFDTIINGLSCMTNEYKERILCKIIGGGSCIDIIQERIKTLKLENNIMIIPSVSKNDLVKYYSESDVLMITLKNNGFIGRTIPTKLQSYMAAGKPIFAILDGDASQVIKNAKCGWCILPGDATAFEDTLTEIINSKKMFAEMGLNARKYYNKNFTLEKITDQIVSFLQVD